MTDKINREPAQAATAEYDLIIIGGGIYGAITTLIASQAGLNTLLIDKNDFGGATSYNSLRTLHGGLRYLQKMDLHRFFESVAERRWFLKNFPDLTHPLACLMPLYGDGVYKAPVFRCALLLNDVLSYHRNREMTSEQVLAGGRVISKEDVIHLFPGAVQESLQGGAFWYDGAIPAPQLVIMQILKWACSLGATVLNYVEAQSLLQTDGNLKGVRAIDRKTGKSYRFNANRVVNAAGPWCRELATCFDKDYPELFRYSMAWNALLDKKALSSCALAVKSGKPGGRVYFLHSWHSQVLAGTVHSSLRQMDKEPMPSDDEIDAFIHDLNLAIPCLHLKKRDIRHMYIGLLPAKKDGSTELAVREVFLDHGAKGGPSGLYSVSGVKFTTARRVAEKLLCMIFPDKTKQLQAQVNTCQPVIRRNPSQFSFGWRPGACDEWKTVLKEIIDSEAVVHLDDLILRRTDIGDNPERAMEIAPLVSQLFGWEQSERHIEVERLRHYYKNRKPII